MTRFLVALGWLVSLPGLLAAQADSAGPGLRLDFGEPPLTLEQPALLRAPWLGAPRSAAILGTQLFDSTVTAALDSARLARAVGLRLLTLYGTPFDTEQPEAPGPRRNVLGLSTKYADIALDGQVRLELRTDRLRNERCTPALLLDPNSGCRGGFKAPRLDNHVDLRSTGIIGRRMHLNLDYQNDRDFSANNDIRVYYEGLEDEIVRRVDVGTVVFQPPPSRFITAAVPSNNFGINAAFEIGPVQLQTLAATQKGSEVAERVYTMGQTTSQAEQRQARDLDFESGRFFWVVDPATLSGYPALDILKLNPATVDPASRPTQVRVYRYRSAVSRTGLNPNLGGITATASRSDSPQRFGPVQWELLIQGSDYYLDPSGLWFTLGTKLDQNDYLAVSYRTAAGTVVGTFPESDQGSGSNDQLVLITEPKQSPAVPTFRYEMRQVYRVAGEDLDPTSLGVVITVNRSERPLSGASETYLQLLGLALPNDANIFDRDNRLFPRSRDPGATQVVHDSYIVFPHLTPFADASRLSPQEVSDSLYRTPLFLLAQQGPAARFSLQLQYNTVGGGDRSTLNLDALQIREGSEQLYLGGRKLERGVDYNISYDLGTVTFLNPDALFGQSSTQVTARFERQGVFAVAPTTILGFSTRYSLGERGAINLIGLYQKEQSAFNRPALGFEASANLIGGVNTELHFKPQFLTRFLNSLTSSAASAPSTLDLNAEFALSKPDINRSGQAYLEEFEADAGTLISLQESSWEFGSRPQQSNGLEDIGFAGGFDPADAVALTWQNLVSVGGQTLRVRPQDIDTLIRLAGQSKEEETVMYLTLHADTAGGMVQQNNASRWTLPSRPFRPRWRSMVTSLSPTGIDLTQDEFLEFWALQPTGQPADSAGLRLVIDLGTVSEDALAVAPDSFAVNGADTLFTGLQYVGAGRLDTERSQVGIFNAGADDIGILGDRPDDIVEVGAGPLGQPLVLCQRLLQNSVPVFPWGDLSSRCTRGNGVLDTEDLNGDGVLDAAGPNESVFRYIVDLAADSFFVRDGVTITGTDQQSTTWKLYRVPLRSVAQTLGTPTMRLVQHLRMTLATPPDAGQPDVVARIALARMRFVGSPWTRRSETPILGLSGALGQPHGAVSSSIVTTENKSDLGYESPPGVTDNVSRRGGDRAAQGTQINEKSLRLRATELGVNERAEAYLRFPSGPKNLLAYRDLRLWVRGRGPGWEEGDLQAFVKLGSDNDNFYLYRAPAKSTTWEPEVIVQLETWRQLRANIENAWLRGDPPSGAAACGLEDVGAYVACDGPYLVQVLSPGVNPPNLAAIQELSAGIYRVAAAVTVPEAELWVDDIRLGEPLSNTGTAKSIDARLAASDVANFTASYISQNGQFRQLNQDPSYKTTDALQLNGGLRLDRFLPTMLGLSVPLTVRYARTGVDPELLSGSDLRGSALPGLRKPDSWSSTYSIAIRRNRPGTQWLSKALFDPLSFTGNLTQGRARTELSEARAKAYAVNLSYFLQMKRRGFRLPLGGLVKGLPKWLRSGQFGQGLEKADVSLVPSRVRLGSGLSRNEANSTAFRVPIARDDDALIRPATSLTHLWQNSAGLTWQPLGMLTLNGDLTSIRDLRVYPDSSPIGRLAYSERRFFLGVPVGVERDRTLTTALALTPAIASWLRPRFLSSSNFLLSRTLSSRPPVRVDEDSGAFVLPQTLNNTRTKELGAGVDFGRALRQLFGDSSGVSKALGRIRPLDLSTRLTRTSTYDLSAFDPSVGYQLALGGLDRFLTREGESAIGASESRTATIAGGADLPFGLSITLSHALTRTTRFQQVSDGFVETEVHQEEWPVGNLRWSQTFRGGPLTQVALGTAVRRRQGSSAQANLSGAPALTATRSVSINPDLQVGLRNGIQLALGMTSLSQHNASNGNETLLDQNDLTGSLNYTFRLPRSLSRQRKQARSSLTVLLANTRTCLQQRTLSDCTVISDVLRKEFRAGLDTDLLQMLGAGLQAGYTINDAKHLSRRTSQISVILSFQLSLFAGDYRQEQ